MITSYHVHSNLSDGIADMEQMILAAIGAGLDEVGMSDHYLLLPDEKTQDWSMPLDHLPYYTERVLALKDKYKDSITVRLGVEADYVPQTIDILRNRLAHYPFDYRIGSVHIADGFPIDNTPKDWEDIDQEKRNQVVLTYWKRIKEMADSRVFNIAGHLDLHKKFAFKATVDYSDLVEDALDSLAAAKMCVELNTSGWYKPAKEQYPSEQILNGCKSRGIPVIVSADAHDPHHIRRDFEKAHALLNTLGITDNISFKSGQMVIDGRQ